MSNWTGAALAAAAWLAAVPAMADATTIVQHKTMAVNGVAVDRYTWFDSKGLKRSVSLKREGDGNAGHGGYAVQMTFQQKVDGVTKTITATDNGEGDGGFGYFVSHELYRDFADGANDTIAHKIFGADDSPLGRGFPVVGESRMGPKNRSAAHIFTLDYPRYGTVQPIAWVDGGMVAKSPTNAAQFQKYTLHVTMTWTFQAGTDFPRIDTVVDMSDVGGPDKVTFDLRAPYGVLDFDPGEDDAVASVVWGDRYHFKTTQSPVTRASSWAWNRENKGSRYHALVAGGYEMGLYEPRSLAKTQLTSSYSDGRGLTSATYHGGNGCPDLAGQLLPCDWEWPYQSLQYSLSYDDVDEPTTGKKIAWGSAPYYGAGPTLPEVYDSPETSQPFVGYPDGGLIRYSTCVVLGPTTKNGLTKAAAAPSGKYSCAKAKVR